MWGAKAAAVAVRGVAGREETSDALRRVYAEFAWLGVLNAAISTYGSVYTLRLGGDAFLVGLLTAGSALSGVLVALVAGPIFRRVDDPWALMLWSRVVCRFPYVPVVILPWIPGVPQAPLFVAFVLSTFVPGQLSTATLNALMPDLVPRATRSRTLSGWYLRLGVVGALTTLVAGWALDRLPFPVGYQLLFAVGFTTALVGIGQLAGVRRPAQGWSVRHSRGLADLDPRQWTPGFRRYLLILMLSQFGYGMGLPLLSIYWVRNASLADGTIGLLATITAIAQVFSFPLWGRLGERFSSAAVLQVAMLLLAAQVLLTAGTRDLVLLGVAAAVGGLGAGGLQFGQYYRLVDLAPSSNRLGYVLSYTAATSAALAVGPLLGTALSQTLGSAVLPLVAAGVVRFASPLLGVVHDRPRPAPALR